jgi:hypothetical protein
VRFGIRPGRGGRVRHRPAGDRSGGRRSRDKLRDCSWLLDGGGPEARIWNPPEFPHLAFPEHLNPVVAPPGWRPEFADYLYLGFTNATAFSPTDVMPLARWCKLAMTVQAFGSLAVLGLVVARAVNIFK